MNKQKFAVALGGGAARGWVHIGVLRGLADAGLEPEIVVGTSIGSIVGGHYASGRLDMLEDFARSLTKRRVFSFLDLSVSGSGLISGQRLFDHFETFFGGIKIEQLPTKFASIATDLSTGQEVWIRRGLLKDAVRASSAIPGIVKPVSINGRWLVDGCLVNPIPVSTCRALGARVVIGVNLTSEFGRGGVHIGDLEDEDELAQVVPDEAPITRWNGRGAFQLLHRQIFGRNDGAPGITSVILNSFAIFHDRISRARLMGDPPDLLVAPNLADIGVLDFHRADEMIEAGRTAIAPHIPVLQSYLNAPPPALINARLFAQ
jgi:NTE family protein